MLEAVAVMQHHDAMTGTHTHRVGEDYLRIMHDRTGEALGGALGHEIGHLGREHGIDMNEITECSVDGYQTVNCL